MSYNEAIKRLVDSPSADGFMYHIAFYKSIEVDSLSHYARTIDSLSRLNVAGDNLHSCIAPSALIVSFVARRLRFPEG